MNTDAQSAPFSKLVMLTALATAKTPKMFPDGKHIDNIISINYSSSSSKIITD